MDLKMVFGNGIYQDDIQQVCFGRWDILEYWEF